MSQSEGEMPFKVAVIDNYHAPNDGACGGERSFATHEAAVEHCSASSMTFWQATSRLA